MSYKYTMLFLRTIFIVSIVWLSFFGPYKAFLNSNPILDKNFIDVYEGSSMYAVLENLKLSSLINKLFFRIYLNTNSIKSFQAGEYDIKNKDFKEIIDLIVEGKTYTHSLTIIEGMNIYDIEKELENSFLINDCSLLICIKFFSSVGHFFDSICGLPHFLQRKQVGSILVRTHRRRVHDLAPTPALFEHDWI